MVYLIRQLAQEAFQSAENPSLEGGVEFLPLDIPRPAHELQVGWQAVLKILHIDNVSVYSLRIQVGAHSNEVVHFHPRHLILRDVGVRGHARH